jgi:hypothetical protein
MVMWRENFLETEVKPFSKKNCTCTRKTIIIIIIIIIIIVFVTI